MDVVVALFVGWLLWPFVSMFLGCLIPSWQSSWRLVGTSDDAAGGVGDDDAGIDFDDLNIDYSDD